ncbi:MAG: hypothetical protein ABQ298_15410 [Puniceicoccaceae bacterium]
MRLLIGNGRRRRYGSGFQPLWVGVDGEPRALPWSGMGCTFGAGWIKNRVGLMGFADIDPRWHWVWDRRAPSVLENEGGDEVPDE